MEINGEYKFKAPINKVWDVLMDKEALQASVPGCEKFEEVEPQTYNVVMKVGVASIKGTYNGRITIADADQPKHYKLIVGGQGGPGFLNGEGIFDLSENSNGGDDPETVVAYKGTANVGGTLAGIGARMLMPVAKKLVHDFFKSMEKRIDTGSEQKSAETA
ncbi:MAG TPA: carbon monoxide dehydrogenase subunit G [Chloroflexia bacterium]|nr:carbon monoxide dehydrogenase subunit G [Chloroflexia bacterium]